ncbi:MAG TPA: serine--tRNA ligase, partial [Gammaproteobacteria bacterium]|nr:serine--tRNA ligase [Gammaproteobacteria bacterium]
MLDPSQLRNQLHEVANALKPRGLELDIERLTKLEDKRKRLQVETETLQRQRNTKSRAIGEAKQRGEDVQTLMAEVAYLGDKMRQAEARFNEVQTGIEIFSLMIPNIPHASVPLGRSEADNLEVRRWGTPPHFNFKPKDHVDLGISLSAMDFEAAVRIASARFVILSGPLARLQRALIQFMLDLHTEE